VLKSVIGDVWIEINRRQRVYRRRFHQSRLRWAWSMYETFNVNRFLSFAQVEYIYLQLFTHSDKTPSSSRVFMKWNWQFFSWNPTTFHDNVQVDTELDVGWVRPWVALCETAKLQLLCVWLVWGLTNDMSVQTCGEQRQMQDYSYFQVNWKQWNCWNGALVLDCCESSLVNFV